MADIFGRFGPGTAENITGTATSDTIFPLGGSDFVNGLGGTDTVVIAASRSSFNLSSSSGVVFVDTISGASGGSETTTLQNVERLRFNDVNVALDVGATQSAGQTMLLLGAVLGRAAVLQKLPLAGTVIGLFDQGFTMKDLSGAVMRLDIWGILANGGNPGATNQQIASYLLTTVNGAAPDAGTLASATAQINSEQGAAQGSFLAQLAASSANQGQVGLVGLAQSGLSFL
ncbi:MAG: hypothetical protein HYX47_15660 [Burkholderiales bacterium]|nr:hypothetical protein [Burkholderiales bacterium]